MARDDRLAAPDAAVGTAAFLQLAERVDGAMTAAGTLQEQVLFLADSVTFLELSSSASSPPSVDAAAELALGSVYMDRARFTYPGPTAAR